MSGSAKAAVLPVPVGASARMSFALDLGRLLVTERRQGRHEPLVEPEPDEARAVGGVARRDLGVRDGVARVGGRVELGAWHAEDSIGRITVRGRAVAMTGDAAIASAARSSGRGVDHDGRRDLEELARLVLDLHQDRPLPERRLDVGRGEDDPGLPAVRELRSIE